ncbi:MAG: phosphate signaling complex protein PhoU [Spirochaetota bacterium]
MIKERILELKEKLTAENALVKKMIEESVQGLIERDAAKLSTVIKKHEPNVNWMEVDIDAACTNIIALYHPEAKDLRTVLMLLKMNNDFERMGDAAVNMCESAMFLIERPQLKPFDHIPKMAEATITMLKDSMRSFIESDVALARAVCKSDDIVDDYAESIFKELVALMTSDPTSIERALNIIRISHNLERIADLSTNIAEDAIFITEGKVIKHHVEDGKDPHARS